MSKEELTQVAVDVARRLGSYPMLVVVILLMAYITWDKYSGDIRVNTAIRQLVFEQLDWDRKILTRCFEKGRQQ